MSTINDIAKEAGVSHGTVSNVLNGRGNVSMEKIRLVHKAAEKLGYKINSKAQELRQGNTKTIALILPSVVSEWCSILYEVLQQELSASGYTLQLFSTQGIETIEKNLLTRALAARVCAVITASCLSDAADYYRSEAAGIPVVFLQQGKPTYAGACSVSFQYEKAGAEIARYVMERGAKTVGVLTSESGSFISRQFLQGLRSVLSDSEITTRVVTCAEHQIDLQAFNLLDQDLPFDFIICTDCRRLRAVRIAHSYASMHPDPQYIALSPHSATVDIRYPYYGLDYKMMAHRIVNALLACLVNGSQLPPTIAVENIGFPHFPTGMTQISELNMLTVASPASVALAHLLPLLERTINIKLHLSVMSLDEIYEMLKDSDGHTPYDLIRMDMAWMDELAEMVYQPLENIKFDWNDLISRFRPEFVEDYTSTRGVRYCLPYDPSTQLLFYRKDLFEDSFLKRMYFEACKQELHVPRTFDEYNRIARFFTQSYNPQSPIKFGSTVAIGNAMVSASEYSVRLFGMGGQMLDPKGRIVLNTPQGIAALRNYAETYEYSDKNQYQWWKNALQGFAEGSAAMTIVFMNHAPDILNLRHSQIAGKVGYAMVPGGKPLIGGGIIGIARSSIKQEAACHFLEWLYSAPVASAFTILGGLSPCQSVYDNRDVYEKYPWLTVAKKSFPIAQRRHGSICYSNYSQHQLEKLLSFEIKNAVMGICSPEEALDRAQINCLSTFHTMLKR